MKVVDRREQKKLVPIKDVRPGEAFLQHSTGMVFGPYVLLNVGENCSIPREKKYICLTVAHDRVCHFTSDDDLKVEPLGPVSLMIGGDPQD